MFALPHFAFFNDFFAAVWAGQVHDLFVVENHFYVAADLVEFGLGARDAEGAAHRRNFVDKLLRKLEVVAFDSYRGNCKRILG